MGTQAAVHELEAERARIDRALAVLRPPAPTSIRKPATSGPRPVTTSAASTTAPKRTFQMSPEAKKKISDAQKARWAVIKKIGKKAA